MHKNKENQLVHVSFDIVDEFLPRVPKQRCPNEDGNIPRICASPTVIQCLQAIPQAGEVMCRTRELGLPVIIHAYYMRCKQVIEDVTQWVGDAAATGEKWLTDKPDEVRRIDYEVVAQYVEWYTDIYGVRQRFPMDIKLKRAKYQDNMDNLLRDYFHLPNERISVFKGKIPDLTYRTLMSHFDEFMEDVENERHNKSK